MVCIYCGSGTTVINSRHQKRANCVWRRRKCDTCLAVFTSIEQADYNQSWSVRIDASHIVAFSRDQLFLSIYDACRHRATALTDATALTRTVTGKLLACANDGSLDRDDVCTIVSETLCAFDPIASTHYNAFHPYDARTGAVR